MVGQAPEEQHRLSVLSGSSWLVSLSWQHSMGTTLSLATRTAYQWEVTFLLTCLPLPYPPPTARLASDMTSSGTGPLSVSDPILCQQCPVPGSVIVTKFCTPNICDKGRPCHILQKSRHIHQTKALDDSIMTSLASSQSIYQALGQMTPAMPM